MRRTIGIAFEGNGGHGDGRKLSELLFELVILRFAFSQLDAKAIVVNHDSDVIRIVEGCRGAIEGGIVEVPFGRRDLPNELREVVPVLVVSGPATLSSKVLLVPPLELGLWRQRFLVGFRARDQVAAH